jgi:transcriptional regulator with XRE-family HTH domain
MERQSIVHKIKMQRLNKGLSQKEVAEHLNITQAQYSKLENSDNEITLTHLLKLVVFLGMKWSDFDDTESLPGKSDLDSPEALRKEVKSISEILTSLSKEVETLKKGVK